MKKQEILEIIAIEARCNPAAAQRAYEAIREQLAFELRAIGRTELPGIVILKRGQRQARTFTNPRTGEQKQLPAKTSLRARCSTRLLDRVTGGSQ